MLFMLFLPRKLLLPGFIPCKTLGTHGGNSCVVAFAADFRHDAEALAPQLRRF
jgi:hypothetical protein